MTNIPYLTLPVAAIFLSCMTLPAWADGTCRITRVYQNDEKQMVHHSRYPLYGEAEKDVSACERVCKRDAVFLPRPDASKVKKTAANAKRVEVRCSFAEKGNDAGKVTARFHASVNQLQLKPASGSSSDSTGYNRNITATTPSGMKTSRPATQGSALITSKDIERDAIHRQKSYPPAYKPTTEASRKSESSQPSSSKASHNPFTTASPKFRAQDYTQPSSSDASSATSSTGSSTFNPRMLRVSPQQQPKTY